MKFLAIEQVVPGIVDRDFTPDLLQAEAREAWQLHQSGVVRELYFRQDFHRAVLVLECLDTQEAESVLGTLPLVKGGLIAFEVIPLIPYDGFSRLFAERF